MGLKLQTALNVWEEIYAVGGSGGGGGAPEIPFTDAGYLDDVRWCFETYAGANGWLPSASLSVVFDFFPWRAMGDQVSGAIDMSGLPVDAPDWYTFFRSVYFQSVAFSPFSLGTVWGLEPGGAYKVQLFGVEGYNAAAGARVIQLRVNAGAWSGDIDWRAISGANLKAAMFEFPFVANDKGRAHVELQSTVMPGETNASAIRILKV